MCVIGMTGDDMPVHMRHLVAEAGKIDLERHEALTHGGFERENAVHQVISVGWIQIGHLGNVRLPGNPAETGVVRIINANHATARVLPEHVFRDGVT